MAPKPEQLPEGRPRICKVGQSGASVEEPVGAFVGIDVAKDHLDVSIRPTGESFRVGNDEAGIGEVVKRLRARVPEAVVLEATGGYEVALACGLATAGIPVAVINPRQVRDFAKALGKLAKTDAIDATVLAHFAEAVKPEARALPDEQAAELQALMARRRQVIEMQTAERNRLARCAATVRARIEAHIEWLQQELDDVDGNLGDAIKRSPAWREMEDLLRSVPGVGPVTSRTLLADLPELGRLNRKQVAALSGLAPLNCDSGTMEGKRRTWGGRASVRTALYMAALVATRYNPVIRNFYQRLISVGKSRKSAVTACAHKLLVILNAMARDRRRWSQAGA
jgi:transposase